MASRIEGKGGWSNGRWVRNQFWAVEYSYKTTESRVIGNRWERVTVTAWRERKRFSSFEKAKGYRNAHNNG